MFRKKKAQGTEEAGKKPSKSKKTGIGQHITIGIGFGLLLAIIIIWVVFYYQPTLKHMHRVGNQVRRWSSMMRISAIPEHKVKALQAEVSQLESDIATIEKKIYPIEEMPRIGRRIIQLGRRHNLVMIAMTPSYEVLFPVHSLSSSKKPLVKLPVTFVIRGRFFDIGRFLEDLPRLPFAFAVDEVSMETTPDVYPNVNIQLKGYFFLLTKDAKFGKKNGETRQANAPKSAASL